MSDPTKDADASAPETANQLDEADLSATISNDPAWKSLIDGLALVERSVNQATSETSKEALSELRNRVLVIQQRAAAMRERIDQTFVEAIRAHGPIEVGTIRYVVSVSRSTRCTNTMATAETLLNVTGGDLVRFCEQLVSQPFKPASVRALIAPDAYRRYFEVVERDGVEGKEAEQLTRIDLRFMK